MLGVALTSAALVSASVLGLSTSASAVPGDSASGCTSGAGCERTLRTNQCTSGAAFWLNVWSSTGSVYQGWGHTNSGCLLRIQHRYLNAGETYAYNSGWYYRQPGSGTGTMGPTFTASKRCYTQIQVRRTDGSYYQSVHYNTRYWDDATFRGKCITG